MGTILEARGIKKYYQTGDVITKALDGVDLRIGEGEFVAVVGSSGSGKSTLLHILGALDSPTEGQVYVEGRDISKMNERERTIFRRRKIGFIFQNYNLIQILSAYENVVLPLQLDRRDFQEKTIDDLFEFLSISDKKYQIPGTLSGGQMQRVAIARALAVEPAIILADEPTGNLDSKTSSSVISLLKSANQKYGRTILMITHSQEIARQADRIIRIEDGRIAEGQINLL